MLTTHAMALYSLSPSSHRGTPLWNLCLRSSTTPPTWTWSIYWSCAI